MRTLTNILFVILLTTTACVQEGSTHGGLAPTHGGSDLLFFRSCSATLQGPTIRGTGVFVSDNILLTAKHVVTGLSDLKITGRDGVTYTAIEILEDVDDDLAVVIIQGRNGPSLDMGPWPGLGDDVICIGTPHEQVQPTITWGRVSSEKHENMFIYDGFAWQGCSGGPVIVNGRLAGITKGRLNYTDSLGFAVPVDRLDSDLLARIP